jgi:DNA-binding XRE family transcriptional regulator
MGTNIKKLREARYLTLEYVADKIGVTEIEMKRIEKRWDDPSSIVARDLAVLLNCNVHELTGKKPEPEEWGNWPFAINGVEGEEFGGVYLNIVGKTLEFAISEVQRERIADQMDKFGSLEHRERDPWINTDTLCGRWLHINPKAVRSLTLKHDDDEATPYYAHPEVYLALSQDASDDDRGPVMTIAVAEAIAAAGKDGDAGEDQRVIKILFLDGSEDERSLDDQWVATALFGMDLQTHDMSPISFLHVEREGGYVNGWINMAHVAMLSIPIERYHRLTAPE